VFLNPPELFLAYVKIAIVAGLVAAAPFVFFQVWMFVRPGLTRGERLGVGFAIVSGSVFFAAGTVFGYLVALPMTLRFFLQYQTDEIRAFSRSVHVGFSRRRCWRSRRVVSRQLVHTAADRRLSARAVPQVRLLIILIAAVLTPPMSCPSSCRGPMLVLYEISILPRAYSGCASAIRDGTGCGRGRPAERRPYP
jgi:sec-independent protein translocase protein TatC